MIVSAIPSEYLDMVWPEAAPLLQKALDRFPGMVSLRQVMRELANDELALWVMIDDTGDSDRIVAVCTTKIVQMDKFRVLRLDYCAGTQMNEWLPKLIERLQSFGSASGCARMEMCGRKGWQRVLNRHGFKFAAVIMDMDLTDG